MLRKNKFILFNTETNWHVIYYEDVYKLPRNLDDIFFKCEDGEVGWEYVSRRLIFIVDDSKAEPICSFVNFELDEKIDFIIVDGDKITF